MTDEWNDRGAALKATVFVVPVQINLWGMTDSALYLTQSSVSFFLASWGTKPFFYFFYFASSPLFIRNTGFLSSFNFLNVVLRLVDAARYGHQHNSASNEERGAGQQRVVLHAKHEEQHRVEQ